MNHWLGWESGAIAQESQSNDQTTIKQSFGYVALYFSVFRILLKATTAHLGANTDELCGDMNWKTRVMLLVELLKDQLWEV